MHDRNSRLRTGIFVGVVIALGLGAAASQTGPQPPAMPPIDVFPEKFGVSIEVTPGNAGKPPPHSYHSRSRPVSGFRGRPRLAPLLLLAPRARRR